MTPNHDPRQNHLLGMLRLDEYQRLAPHLELVELSSGQSLAEPGQVMRYVYFPTESIISLLSVLRDGNSTEVSVVGAEGMLGVSLFMGDETTLSRAMVQSGGTAYRLEWSILRQECERGGSMQGMLLLFTQALMIQVANTVACSRLHSIEQQLCRWLLLSLDRRSTNELVITQGLIAGLLGVRRGSVSESAHKLQQAGLISYSRGSIHVKNRHGLEARVCECYSSVKKEYDRLLSYQRRRVPSADSQPR
jgi:CRP-like cAMP-binding protein